MQTIGEHMEHLAAVVRALCFVGAVVGVIFIAYVLTGPAKQYDPVDREGVDADEGLR